jgi:uncharacterized protein YjgD (DUF1641 family)
LIISIKEARKILGKSYEHMSDEEVESLIENLDAIAIVSLRDAREKRMKQDANDMANLIYDIYQDKKRSRSPK